MSHWDRRTASAAALIAMAFGWHAGAAEPKRDFRGLVLGMSVPQAEAAAAANGMSCATSFNAQTVCRGGDATVTLATTGRRGNHVYQLQVGLAGHYDAAEMRAGLIAAYGLKPSATTPQVFDTAAGQQLMLLEIGPTATIFYLTSAKVLADDTKAEPPPPF